MMMKISVEPFAGSGRPPEFLARRILEVVRRSEQGVLAALEEGEILAAEPGVFLLAHLVERIAPVTDKERRAAVD